jgi:peptidase S46-like protein
VIVRLLLCACLCAALPAAADEGMFTFDNPPSQQLQQAYGFTPASEWLDHVRLASVRFNDGGSGAFISADGLMISNHHVGLGCIQNLSSAEKDYVTTGYLAASRAEEPPCPGYEVNVLMNTEDVTLRVLGAVSANMSDKAAHEARKAEIARIETECAKKTGQRCDVIPLYQGAVYHLYTYKKYTDVRLVFAPEQQIAFYGGDPDNFSFPRHDLDIAIFRAYENGQPARSPAYLPFARETVKDGELVFVSGNPGSTARQETMAQLETAREVLVPEAIDFAKQRLAVLREFARTSPEAERRARAQIFGLENSQKAFQGRLDALQDEKAMARRAAEEKALRDKIAADPALAGSVGDAYDVIAAAEKKGAARQKESRYMSFGGSRLLGLAGVISRYVTETKKPNEVRLEEYVDSNLASLENNLYSKAPIYDDLEIATLTHQLTRAQQALGADHAYVKAVLGARTPAEVAWNAVKGTQLRDVEARRALVKGGEKAVASSKDPMIALARTIDPFARGIRRFKEDEVEAVVTRAHERLGKARFAAYGTSVPPDATFTLRLSYGVVKPYPYAGTMQAARTTFYGLYDRAASWEHKHPWDLPQRYLDRQSKLKLDTALNFVHTADIIGGNSGSPTINREGEFVGIIFDGNIESLAWDYFYTDEKGRAVSVDAQGILEALAQVYEAGAVVEELTSARPAAGTATR